MKAVSRHQSKGTAAAGASGPGTGATVRDILRNRNFRLLWTGEGISLVGDQLYLIALPWLVLQLTGSAFAMGTVLALAAIPRALFMLLGGALTDRLSPRVLMLCSNLGRLTLVATLAVLTLGGVVQLWMLYAFALLFGLADAFFFPAQSAMVPKLIGQERLQTGNAVIQGTAQLSMFVGPALAGVLIAVLDGGAASVPDRWGIGVVFALDAASFLASVTTLSLMRLDRQKAAGEAAAKERSVLSSIAEGLSAMWKDRVLRYYFVLIAAANFLITGPFSVGIPVLAHTRYSGGAAAFGIILSTYGAGSLAGVLLAGSSRRPSARKFPALMLGLTAFMGVSLVLLGVMPSITPAAIVATIMGLAQGYVVIQFVTWLQMRTPDRMLGRTMSLLMFAVVGLAPVSSTVAGALIQVSATGVLIGAGVLMVLVVAVGSLSPSVWRLGNEDEHEGQRLSSPAPTLDEPMQQAA
ncbi:MAG: MFS transporter [bacterium]